MFSESCNAVFLNFRVRTSQGLTSCRSVVLGFKQSLDICLHPLFMVFVTQVMWCEPILQTAIALAFSIGRNLRPERPWIAVGAFGPFVFIRAFAIGQIA
jgi:hypothetical protein